MEITKEQRKEALRYHDGNACTLALLMDMAAMAATSPESPIVVREGSKDFQISGVHSEGGKVVVTIRESSNKALPAGPITEVNAGAFRPDIVPDAKYCIKDTCRLLGIHRHTLHAWTESGKIKCVFRKVNGRPAYKGSEILKCWAGTY